MKPRWFIWIALCLLVILGAALRLEQLSEQSLWQDEAMQVAISENSVSGIIDELKTDVTPPLSYYIFHYWIEVFGDGEVSVRLLPAILGILLIPAIFFVGSSFFSRRTGIISALLVSVSVFHIEYSQEARMYSLLAILGLLAMYFLYRALATGSRLAWVLYTVTSVLAVYTHYYGAFIAMAGVGFFLIYRYGGGRAAGSFIAAESVLFICCLPLLFLFASQHVSSKATYIPPLGWGSLEGTLKLFTSLRFSVLVAPWNSVVLVLGLAAYGSLSLAGIAALVGRRKAPGYASPIRKPLRVFVRDNMPLMLVVCYLAVTLAVPAVISIKDPIYYPRYTMSAWPAFILLLAYGLATIRRTHLLAIATTAVILPTLLPLYHYYSNPVTTDRDVASFIKERATGRDIIVFLPGWANIPIAYYLRDDTAAPGTAEAEDLVRQAGNLPGEPGARIFLIYQDSVIWINSMPAVRKELERSLVPVETDRFGDKEITVYQRSSPSAPALPA